jgi:hypothetical protein
VKAELKKAPSPKSKAGGSTMRESFVSTMAFHVQDPVTKTRTNMYTTLDLVSRDRNFRSRNMPVTILAEAPTTAVRNDARALERTVK